QADAVKREVLEFTRTGGRLVEEIFAGDGQHPEVLVDVELPGPDSADRVTRDAQVAQLTAGATSLAEQVLGLAKPMPEVAARLKAVRATPGSDEAGMLGTAIDAGSGSSLVRQVTIVDDGENNGSGITPHDMLTAPLDDLAARLAQAVAADATGI